LKSTHRPGFYIHINSPKRLRIQTSSKTFDLDRYCPHANADMLKWVRFWHCCTMSASSFSHAKMLNSKEGE
jgi:hypothetical protein